MSQSIKHSSYRQRVYLMPDGSIELIFGDDPRPAGATVECLCDHVITETSTVTDYVGPGTEFPPPTEPAPAPAPAA